ncbi:MAG: RsmB/NOP family class I SAM-dependent RNA methyltransferase [Oscillospiraceae bacterium]|nr:RsmB/NOP family class I SAM-dependent RNA methyltransferase [Oscillospiraceae bacterium]
MLPKEFIQRMERLLGAEAEDFFASYDRPRNTGIRMNTLKTNAPLLPFCTDPIPWTQNGYYLQEDSRPGLHPYHAAGVYYLQEPSAMAPVGLLDVQPGHRVLDLCAAPGGKSTQIAEKLQGQGLLVCNEIHPKRARILSSNIERLGVTNALVLNEHPAKLAERFPNYFHRILVDAPCSGEGMFRKEDAAVTDWSEETVAMCAARQKEILNSAARMLAPGGKLVYSTCTFAPEENEGVISHFLHSHRDFSVAQAEAPWFTAACPHWIEEPASGIQHCFRLLPHKLRGEGHFAALLEKAAIGEAQPQPLQKAQPLPPQIREFLPLQGQMLSFGETCYLAPQELPELKGLKVLRVGLELGELRKGRFIPAHGLALALKDFPKKVRFPADSPEISAYLTGLTIPGDVKGWALLCVDDYPLGWVRGADGILKNHYPKGLRRPLG